MTELYGIPPARDAGARQPQAGQGEQPASKMIRQLPSVWRCQIEL
jgi:hypothetical protein